MTDEILTSHKTLLRMTDWVDEIARLLCSHCDGTGKIQIPLTPFRRGNLIGIYYFHPIWSLKWHGVYPEKKKK